MANLSQNLHRAIIILFHLLLFITPFIWNPSNSELFEVPKMFFTYTLTLIIISLWTSRMVLENRLIYKRTFLDIPLALFLASQFLSTILSIDPHTSFFGYYSRLNGGLLSTLTYVSLYYAATANLNQSAVIKLIKTLLVAVGLTSAYSFLEHFGHSPSCYLIRGEFSADCWIQDVQTRVFGTFGQPNWQAAYIVTTIFIPLAWIVSSTKANNHFALLRTLHFALFTLLLVVLIFTKSRSGLLGLGLGFILFWILAFVMHIKQKMPINKLIINVALSALLLSLSFFAFGRSIHPKLDQVVFNQLNSSHPGVPALRDDRTPSENENPPSPNDAPTGTSQPTNLGGTESSDIRLIVWQGALETWRQHPVLGTGVETFAYAYYENRPEAHNHVSEWDFLYNKAHNEFLNYLSNTGLIGLLTYLLLIATYAIWSLKQIFTRKLKIENWSLLTALISGFSALCISNFFGFSTVAVNTLFFLFPAFAFTLAQPKPNQKDPKMSGPVAANLSSTQLIGLLITLLALIAMLHALYKMYTADFAYASGQTALEVGDLANAITLFEKAAAKYPQEPNYSEQLSLAYAQAALSLSQINEATAAAVFANNAIKQSDHSLRQNPHHLNYYKTRARVFVALANLDASYSQVAEQTLAAAIKLAPTDPKLVYNLGLLHEQLGNVPVALTHLEQAVKLKPDYGDARLSLAKLHQNLGNLEEAKVQYQYLLDNFSPPNPNLIEAINLIDKQLATQAAQPKPKP